MSTNREITWQNFLLHEVGSDIYEVNPEFENFDLNAYREKLAIAKAKRRLREEERQPIRGVRLWQF